MYNVYLKALKVRKRKVIYLLRWWPGGKLFDNIEESIAVLFIYIKLYTFNISYAYREKMIHKVEKESEFCGSSL